jgi:hypothetical protein
MIAPYSIPMVVQLNNVKDNSFSEVMCSRQAKAYCQMGFIYSF